MLNNCLNCLKEMKIKLKLEKQSFNVLICITKNVLEHFDRAGQVIKEFLSFETSLHRIDLDNIDFLLHFLNTNDFGPSK